jgi:hypothetical protein
MVSNFCVFRWKMDGRTRTAAREFELLKERADEIQVSGSWEIGLLWDSEHGPQSDEGNVVGILVCNDTAKDAMLAIRRFRFWMNQLGIAPTEWSCIPTPETTRLDNLASTEFVLLDSFGVLCGSPVESNHG